MNSSVSPRLALTAQSWVAQLARHTLSAFLSVVCLTVATGAARAAPAESQPAEPFRLVWSSTAHCEDAEAFSSELKSRTALLRDADREEHAITVIVETFPELERVRGRLTLRRPSGELAVREVPGANCEEVESALALIVVLMVDPLAADLASAHRLPAVPSPPRAPSPLRGPDWNVRLEHRLTARSGVAPSVAWGQTGRLVVTRESRRWQPSLGLGANFAHATTSAPAGSAELDWAAAQLTLCPAATRPNARWDLRACAAFQLGRLRGMGFATERPASKSIPWLAAGVELEARFRLLGPLWAGLDGGLTFPLTREGFYLDPQQSLYRVPSWAVSVGGGVGLLFF